MQMKWALQLYPAIPPLDTQFIKNCSNKLFRKIFQLKFGTYLSSPLCVLHGMRLDLDTLTH
jgi:hypothetical protein